VIGIIENQAPTRHLQLPVTTIDGEIVADTGQDIAKVALVERHQGSGRVTLGLVHGFGFDSSCAVASTVAHDSHHMLVVGTNDSDMALAANELVRTGGGQIVVQNGEVIGLVELPIAGLMSSEPAEIVAEKAGQVLEGFKSCGCTINNPNMQLSLLALVVIPELRISDQGLVDVNDAQFRRT
jgi:adenine deaminase